MGKRKKTSFVTNETSIVDFRTGEVLKELKTASKKEESEDHFLKVYLEDIRLLSGVSHGVFKVLLELVETMNYKNIVVVNSSIKKRICEKLEIFRKGTKEPSLNTIDQCINRLIEGQILFRDNPGVFKVNPFIIAKGYWQDIQQIRMEIIYDKKNNRYVKVTQNISHDTKAESGTDIQGIPQDATA